MEFKDLAEQLLSPKNRVRIGEDYERFTMYNGKVREAIKNAIDSEFKLPETVRELEKRIVPINIIQKIINKLAAVYQQPATRAPKDQAQSDQEAIDVYEESFHINQKMKIANRFFKLHKHTVLEPFLDRDGIPRLRVLPSQSYTPFSDDPIQPERMTMFVKHIYFDAANPDKTRFHVWTDDEFYIIDGKGNRRMDEMLQIGNEEGVNPYGRIPFVYIAEMDDNDILPIPDDDLKSMAITIPLLLTDLAFASKYQLWSMLAVVGSDAENITFNPNSVMSLPVGADVKVIKPELDSDKALAMVEQLTGMLLTTKNLSVGDISGTLTSENASSGVAMMLDKAETTEDRKDQQAYFDLAEKELWDLFAHYMLPYWVDTKQIDADYAMRFSEQFELSIKFADPKPFIGDTDRVNLEVTKLNNKLTTQKKALKVIHPELDGNQIDDLDELIKKEQKEKVQDAQRFMMQTGAAQVSLEGADTDDAAEITVQSN